MLGRIKRLERLIPAQPAGRSMADWRRAVAEISAASARMDLGGAEFGQAAADFMAAADCLMPNVSRALRLAYGDGAGDVEAVRQFFVACNGGNWQSDG